MKKKGSKKRVSDRVSSNKRKRFFLWNTPNNKVAPLVLMFVFLALAILLPFVTTGNSVNASITGHAGSFLDQPASISLPSSFNWLDIGSTWRDILVYIIVLGIIFVMLYDILTLVSIFSNWVSLVIAIGISIIASLTNVVRQISVFFITLVAGMGVAAGFIEIIVSIVIFVGLIFGNNWIALWAAKRKAQKVHIAGIKGAAEAETGIEGLRKIGKEFSRNRTNARPG